MSARPFVHSYLEINTDLYHRDPAKELSKSDWELVNSIIKIGKKYIWEKSNINA